jgi:hypothetical protein
MVLDHLLLPIQPQSFLECTRTSFEQSLAKFFTILLTEYLQVALEIYTNYHKKVNTTLVVQNEQQAGAHKATSATSRDYKETRKLQHTDQTSIRGSSVGNILKFKKC